jgi:hypothetical protein
MREQTVTRFFLGANSAEGFYSLYDGFARPEDGIFLWAIKGGPGCGKSSFMKRIGARAESAGLDVEYISCSGDPDSLDAVYLPQKGVAYADGTAPHVLNIDYPAAGGMYLDIGAFYDTDALVPHLGEIMELNSAYKALYDDAYALLSAAGAVGIRPTLMTAQMLEQIKKRAAAAVGRETERKGGKGRLQKRFIGAISCLGRVRFSETAASLCSRFYIVDNALGFAGAYLSEICRSAQERGADVIYLPDPLTPDTPEGVILPQAELGFFVRGAIEPPEGAVVRNVRLDALADPAEVRAAKPALRVASKLREALVSEAVSSLAQAKQLHDELERVYNPHVDFDGVYALADKHAAMLGL